MGEKWKQPWRSVTVRLAGILLALSLPVVFMAGYINVQFMRSGMAQVEQSRTRLLESEVAQIDRELDLAANYMNSLTFYNSTTVYLTDRSSPEFYYAANSIQDEIGKTSLFYQYMSGFFLRVPSVDFSYLYMKDSGLQEQEPVLEEYLSDVLTEDLNSCQWKYAELNGSRYLLRGYESNGIWGGSFLCMDRLPAFEEESLSGEGIRYCMEDQLEGVEVPKKSTLLSAKSERCGLVAYEILNQSEAVASLPFLQRYVAVITVFMALSVPLIYLLMRRLVVEPLRRLTGGMHQLENGDLEVQLDENRESTREFRQISGAFNQMTRQIRSLKIAVYEEQLQTEKTKLQNLSYQLRPHFMVNCLNMAYNMITCKEYSSALKLMRFSANYMRYLLREEGDFVPLKEELRHIEDYMGIQQMRYEGLFDYKTKVDPFVEDIDIPGMILQNFVENSIKYSIAPGRFTKIRLSVGCCEADEEPQVCITVKDNGDGYPDWLLQALEKQDEDALRDRVGLRNTLQRIRMLYGDRARCEFVNDGGAVTRFFFPLDPED